MKENGISLTCILIFEVLMASSAAGPQQGAAVLDTKASTTEGKSVQSFLASLAAGGMVFIVEIAAFFFLRVRLPEQ